MDLLVIWTVAVVNELGQYSHHVKQTSQKLAETVLVMIWTAAVVNIFVQNAHPENKQTN